MKPHWPLPLLLVCALCPRPAQAQEGPGPRYAEILRKIIEINSGTGNAEGADKVRAALIPEFEALGFKATVHALEKGYKVLSFEFPDSAPDLLLVGHVDTVFPADNKFQKFAEEPDRFRGPGVIDMKGGVVLLLNALAEVKEPALLRRVRVVLNDDEEIGSVYSKEKLKELGRGLHSGLVYEPGLSDGSLVTAHSGIQWLEIRVKGRAAHAGLEHEKGINACVDLADKLVRLHALTDYSRHLTVNVGTMAGGIAANVVCEEATAKVDVRFVDQKDLDRTLERISQIVKTPAVRNPLTGETASAEIKEQPRVPSMTDQSTKALLEKAVAAGAEIGQRVTGRWVGYGSDANGLAKIGMNLLVGMGPYGSGLHTDGEQMSKRSYGERLRLSATLIRKILSSPQPPLN